MYKYDQSQVPGDLDYALKSPVLNQTTKNFQEILSLVIYKSKLNKTSMDRCILHAHSDGPHVT